MNLVLSGVLRVVLFVLGLAVSALPRRLELALGRALGRFLLVVDPKRRRIAEENMRRCLPELGEQGLARLLRENYEHYGILALELLHIFSPIPGHWPRYTRKNTVVDGLDVYRRLEAQGKGTIAVAGHFGNWEFTGLVAREGVRVMVTGKRVKPEWLNDIVFRQREANLARTASGKRILPELIRWIKEGNTSCFILDQYTAPPSGVPARFFGALVDTQGVVGLVHQRTGAPIFMAYCFRDENGLIHVVFEDAALSEEELGDSLKLTQALTSRIEGWLRKHPAQWLWVHRRFKNAVWPDKAPSAA